jgi:uncharacterized membrane protein
MATELITPKSIAELRAMRKSKLKELIDKKQSVTGLNKLALWITAHVGSMQFFVIIFGWTAIWLGWNIFGPKEARFDPYPAFVLWLFISNMIQLFLMPLIMIGQNLQSEHADGRAEADFEINKQAELEIETILTHLENQNKIIMEILDYMKDKKQ